MIHAQNPKGNQKNMKPKVLAKFKMAAAAILNSRFRLLFLCYLSDLHQILHTDTVNAAAHYNNTKPEVEFEIQDGGGGHIGFFKMLQLGQLLTDFLQTWSAILTMHWAIWKKQNWKYKSKIQSVTCHHMHFKIKTIDILNLNFNSFKEKLNEKPQILIVKNLKV